jgi:hypothetical protein
MSRKPVSVACLLSAACLLLAVRCLCCLLSGAYAAVTPPDAVVVAARVLIEQLTVSDRQLILLTGVHVSDSVCVLLGK